MFKPNEVNKGGKADVRRTLLDAAVRLIDEEGLAALSMREVARRAGVSHQAPYHYFADRGAILATLAEEGFHLLTMCLRQAAKGAKNAVTRLETGGAAYVHFALAHRAHFRLMFRPELAGDGDHPQRDVAGKTAYAELRALAAATAGPKASEAEVDAHASYHWAVAHGLATLLLDSKHGAELAESASQRIAKVMRLHARGMALLAKAGAKPKVDRKRPATSQ